MNNNPIFILIFLMMSQLAEAHKTPKRAILIIIDGLHIDAPTRLAMPNYNRLAKQGAFIKKTCVIMPHHPTHGTYADVHTCSYPNPVMMTGTVFLAPHQKMLQHSFKTSAFIANTTAYESITAGYQFVVQESNSDSFSVDNALIVLANHDIDFIRIHLQDAGKAGYETFCAEKDAPYLGDIWHRDSPYRKAIEAADHQLGRLITALEQRGELANTLLVVTGDHGQSLGGWHPILDEAGWLTPMVFHGPGVKRGAVFEWADQTDITPTIADVMQVDIPNQDGGSGRVLNEIKKGSDAAASNRSKLLELNRLLARYAFLSADLVLRSKDTPTYCSHWMLIERDFYGLDRILYWKEKESIDNLMNQNETLINQMETLLSGVTK